MLFDLCFDVPHRPTHDVDFLGFVSAEIPQLEDVFKEICRIEVEDGMEFQPGSVKAAEIRKEANYAGVRVTLTALLGGARCHLQVDIGFGDAVVPGAEDVHYPVILDDMPVPKLQAYPRYTVVAEKLEALVSLGILNSRMKDFFDLWVLAEYSDFDGAVLVRAVAATFERRRTVIPQSVPIGLSDEFSTDALKQKQWQAFLRKNAIAPKPLETVIADLRKFLLPVLQLVSIKNSSKKMWCAGKGWR